VRNIRHAVKKLNGVLVKPNETFSTLLATGPFTIEDGYVSELVIKGDSLKPEVGGGLCQIGSTLFRMAMNAGMSIVERRSHSLVVHYYSDPRNGNPGTDATIYDPAPDFKFHNDTGHHVLIQTAMNEATGDLAFTLWGATDGRTASYTAPIVTRWIPHGVTKTVETTKLAPGEKKCQKAFNGAETTFTYTRILADGTEEKRNFGSYYRPLPEICLLGVAAVTTSSTVESVEGVPTG
jgi:vancomycin resistance protein YoaR